MTQKVRIQLISFTVFVFILPSAPLPCTGTCKEISGLADFDWKKHSGEWEVVYLPQEQASVCGIVKVTAQNATNQVSFGMMTKTVTRKTIWRRKKSQVTHKYETKSTTFNVTAADASKVGAFQFTANLPEGLLTRELYAVSSDPDQYLALYGCRTWTSPELEDFNTVTGMLLMRRNANLTAAKAIFDKTVTKLGGCMQTFKYTNEPRKCGSSFSASISNLLTMLSFTSLMLRGI